MRMVQNLSALRLAGLMMLCVYLFIPMAGCSWLGLTKDDDKVDEVSSAEVLLKPVQQAVDPVAPMILRVVGYGAINEKAKGQSKVQKRLLAIRASRLDAYRSMAERVYGTRLSGSSTVKDVVIRSDSFRTYVDTFIHGSRVVSTDVLQDGSVETVLEMVIDQGFRNCLTTENNMRFNADCKIGVVHDSKGLRTSRYQDMNRVQSQSSIPETNHYFVE